MTKAIIIKVLFLFLSVHDLCGQKKYWISSTGSDAQQVIDSLQLTPENCSEWAQTCSYFLDQSHVTLFQKKGIAIQPVLHFLPTTVAANKSILGFALEQIEAQHFIGQGLTGAGVKIGIIDGGFLKADKDESLKYFFENDLVAYYKDFVTPDMEMYGGAFGLDDNHGTEVWQLIGGINGDNNVQYGLATRATYYLARTDHGGFERRVEEDYLIAAMEEMALLGVKLFNISLGYTTDFDNKTENYTVADLDGKTSVLTKALDKAALEKGLLFVVAAGNDGNTNWGTLSVPADAKNVLTVGASKFKIWDKINYSSIGPEKLDYVKPNISVYSTLGTSYTAPVVTGLAACMMQYDTTLTNFQIMEILEKASNFYPYGNNYLGYGVPTCPKILTLLEGGEIEPPKTIRTSKSSIKIKDPFEGKTVVIFHKKDERNLMHRIVERPKKDKIEIDRPDGCQQSTVLIETKIIEIFWED